MNELEDRLRESEEERRQQTESMKKLMNDVELAKEKEERTKKELEVWVVSLKL